MIKLLIYLFYDMIYWKYITTKKKYMKDCKNSNSKYNEHYNINNNKYI